MNPFAWSGGKFLLFYAVVAVAVIAFVAWRARGRSDSRVNVTFMTSDPYRIAYLRGDSAEVIRVSVFNLVDRGLIELREDGLLVTVRKDAESLVRRAIDRAVLAACFAGTAPEALVANEALLREARAYGRDLEREGLLPDAPTRRSRLAWLVGALAVLVGVAGVKAVVALAQGRTNLVFLAILTVIACLFAARASFRRLTATGKDMLDDLKVLTMRLLGRAGTLKPGGASNEALLLAATYGIWALPAGAFPFVETLYPRPRSDGGGDSGSSGSDSGDSSCGGGGGCGGCGSD
ncbi:MAG: TIGR04222 domain-containing membrane protein [Betaproteobacteria bacterium]|nr:TIGR04222 domain-containing membrane protein [Betaproteobacteria bacterium]